MPGEEPKATPDKGVLGEPNTVNYYENSTLLIKDKKNKDNPLYHHTISSDSSKKPTCTFYDNESNDEGALGSCCGECCSCGG